MKPKVAIITLSVADLDRSREFYETLGFPRKEFPGDGIIFFQLENIILALYPHESFAEEVGTSGQADAAPRMTLAHNVASKEAVNSTFAEAVAAGATAVKQPAKMHWGGYSSYIADPDGHLWEIAHNPFEDLT